MPSPFFEFRLENGAMNARFEGSLISPDEEHRIKFPLVPAGSDVTHLGLLFAHQCCSATRGLLFTHLWWVNVHRSHGHTGAY